MPVYRNEVNETTANTVITRTSGGDTTDIVLLGANAYALYGSAASSGGIGVYGRSSAGVGVRGDAGAAGETSILGVKTTFGHAVVGSIDAPSSAWAATVGVTNGTGSGVYGTNTAHGDGVQGVAAGKGNGVYASSALGRGGRFSGRKAQIRLDPSSATTHPASGAAGDIFLDASKRLWLCKGGSSWTRLDT